MEDGSLMCIVPILLFLALIFMSIYFPQMYKKKLEQKKQALLDQMRRIGDMEITQSYISVNGETAIGVDENRNLLVLLLSDRDDHISYRILSAINVLGVELFEGGKSSKQVRNKALTGALVGSIFGGAGAIIGANVVGSKAAKDVDNISLVLTLNDTQEPTHQIIFRTPNQKNSRANEEAQHWMSVLEILVHRAESGQISPVINVEPRTPKHIEPQKAEPLPVGNQEEVIHPIVSCVLRSASAPGASALVVKQPRYSIGRSQTNDLILQDGTVSRQHAVLCFDDNAWKIRDINSTAGVFINGKRVVEKRLHDGDQIQIGKTVFIFQRSRR